VWGCDDEFDGAVLDYMSCTDFFGQMKLTILSLCGKWTDESVEILETGSDLILLLASKSSGLELLKHHWRAIGEFRLPKIRDVDQPTTINAVSKFKKTMKFAKDVLKYVEYLKEPQNNTTKIQEVTAVYCAGTSYLMSRLFSICERERR